MKKYEQILAVVIMLLLLSMLIRVSLFNLDIIMAAVFIFTVLRSFSWTFLSRSSVKHVPAEGLLLMLVNAIIIFLYLKELAIHQSASDHYISVIASYAFNDKYIEPVILYAFVSFLSLIIMKKHILLGLRLYVRIAFDTMPGIHMSIDSNLANGILSEDDAARERQLVSENYDLHGALDGLGCVQLSILIAIVAIYVLFIIYSIVIYFSSHHNVEVMKNQIQYFTIYSILSQAALLCISMNLLRLSQTIVNDSSYKRVFNQCFPKC